MLVFSDHVTYKHVYTQLLVTTLTTMHKNMCMVHGLNKQKANKNLDLVNKDCHDQLNLLT